MATIPEIQELLEWLRDPGKNEKPEISRFKDLLPEAVNRLNLPKDTNLASLEAFLIQAAYAKFSKAKESKIRDACLMDLGLLRCCYHTIVINGVSNHTAPTTRRKAYLQYVNRESTSCPHPMSELDVEISEPDTNSALERRARLNRPNFARKIHSIVQNDSERSSCFKDGIKNFVINDVDGNQKINLPEPSVRLRKLEFEPPKQSPHEPESISIKDPAIKREQNCKKNGGEPQLGTVENSQRAPYQKTDSFDSISRNCDGNVIKNNGNDSHDMNIPIVNIYINSAQDDPPIPDIIEPAPPSIEYLTPETPPQPVPHPAMKSLSIIERLKRLFRRNTHAKKGKTPCHAKKCLAGVIAAVLALVAIILLCTAVWPRSNTYTWPIPTSYPGNDPYSMPEQYIIPTPIEGLSFLGNTNVGLTISPGCRVPLPITVIPEESSNAYLTLDSSDGNIVRAYDIRREIEAIENPNVTEPLRSVTITVRPLPSDAASPNIELQIPVLVDYQTDSEDITQKPVMGAEKTTGSIAEPLS